MICFDAKGRRDYGILGRSSIYSDWKTLEKHSANLQSFSGLEGIFSNLFFFVQDEGFEVRSALSLFTINAVCYLPSVDISNLPQPSWARDHENWTLRIPPVRNAHVYRCDSAEYQNELVCTNSQTDYTYALDNAWAGSKSQANTTRGSSFITSNSS